VGSVTRFDATGSRGAPIVHYHFQYTEPGVKQEFGFDEPDPDHPRTVTIADGTGADATWVFPWNRGQNFSIPIPGLPGNATSFRDPVTAQVTVTDATGATAQASAPVPFLQTTRSYDGSWTRSPDCPSVAPYIPAFPFPLSAVGVSPVVAPSGPVIVNVPCRSVYLCSGVLSVSSADIATNARARRRAPKPIALTSFEIAPHTTARVRAPLSKAGRRLLRQRKHLRVRVTLMYLSPTGAKGVTRSKTAKIALKRHGRH
jgi:hypothetical protein